MGENHRSRRAVLVATNVDLLESLVRAAGYEVVAAAASGVNGEALLRQLESRGRGPDVIVVEHDLVGPSGRDAVPGLRAASPAAKVLLVVNEEWTPRDLGSSGAFAVVTRSRLGELVTELDGVDRWIAGHGTGADGADRRTGRDRRVRQDWGKVGWERRTGERRAA